MISRTVLRARNPTITTSSSNPLRTLTRFNSSCSSSSAAPKPRSEPDSGVGGGGSEVYQESRKFARPATVTWSERLRNSVSLIGTVEYPVKQYATNDGKVGAHTILLVKPSPNSHRHFRVTLCMWDLLAERALVHLKQNDYIYVSGQLGSYTKSTLDGAERMYYKVTANELNYVQVPDENYLVAAKSESEADEWYDDYSLLTQTNAEEKRRKRLHLWQLLFANPDEWYDQRKTKKSTRHPDFKHKSTGEALWLNKDDPSWIRKQVDLLDSRLTGRPSDDSPFGSFTLEWVSDNQLVLSDSMESSLINDDSYDK